MLCWWHGSKTTIGPRLCYKTKVYKSSSPKCKNFLEKYRASYLQSTPLNKELFAPLGLSSPDCAVFWDFGVLWQKKLVDAETGEQQEDRTDEQKAQFGAGLKASNVWYGHAHALTLVQPELPPDSDPGMTTYADSGWCFVEASLSSVLKSNMRRVDVGKFTAKKLFFSNVAYAIEESAKGSERPPVRLPSRVAELLQKKSFFSRADVDTVAGLYRTFFEAVVPCCERLELSNLGWGAKEASELAATLPSFERLAVLKCAAASP